MWPMVLPPGLIFWLGVGSVMLQKLPAQPDPLDEACVFVPLWLKGYGTVPLRSFEDKALCDSGRQEQSCSGDRGE